MLVGVSSFDALASASPVSVMSVASILGDLFGACGVAECGLVPDRLAGRCGGPAAIGCAELCDVGGRDVRRGVIVWVCALTAVGCTYGCAALGSCCRVACPF